MDTGKLDYQHILSKVEDCSDEELISTLMEELPDLWCGAYLEMSPRQMSVIEVRHDTFKYIYDLTNRLDATDDTPSDLDIAPRLIAVLGLSAPSKKARDDYRLKGWVGPTEQTYGPRRDKGHFIANSFGGAVDRLEINVFVQRRDLNRGWSSEGKRYREMEKYCMLNPGTFCFSRPIYRDQTSIPAFLEFGILLPSRKLWMECFDNR